MNRTRAWRRDQRQRAEDRAEHVFRGAWDFGNKQWWLGISDEAALQRKIRTDADNMKRCSMDERLEDLQWNGAPMSDLRSPGIDQTASISDGLDALRTERDDRHVDEYFAGGGA